MVPLFTQMAHVTISVIHIPPARHGQPLHANPLEAPHQVRPYTVLATGHCPGVQTINHAELFAILVAAEEAHKAQDDAIIFFVQTRNLHLQYLNR